MNKLFSLDNFQDKDRTFGFNKNPNLEAAVKCGIDLTNAYMKKNFAKILETYGYDHEPVENYEDLNKGFQKLLFGYVYDVKDFDLSKENMQNFKSPKRMNTAERERYYDVVTAVETTVTPAVANIFTGEFNEVKNIAWGDTAEFDIESNEILIAKKTANGVAFGTNQRLFNGTKTVNTESLNITFETDWYQVAAGKADFGKMFFKASQGFINYLTVAAYNKLLAMANQLPASYKFTGFTTENIDLATMAVSGANGGVECSIIGTLPALRQVVPTNDFFKLGIGEEWVKMGYVGLHAGTPLVKITNLLNPTTINSNQTAGTPSFMFRNNVLFVMPFVGRKPVKTVFEGDLFNITLSAVQTADKTEAASLTYNVGVDFVYDQIMGLVSAN